jgi:hypothetical protein
MGYQTFESMCLNAPEIIERHTWKQREVEIDGIKKCFAYAFGPKIPPKNQALIDDQREGLESKKNDPLLKAMNEVMKECKFPSDKELAVSF